MREAQRKQAEELVRQMGEAHDQIKVHGAGQQPAGDGASGGVPERRDYGGNPDRKDGGGRTSDRIAFGGVLRACLPHT